MAELAEIAKRAIAESEVHNDHVNLVDVIATYRGWHPLTIGESMTVGFGDGKEYTITRNPNRTWIADPQ